MTRNGPRDRLLGRELAGDPGLLARAATALCSLRLADRLRHRSLSQESGRNQDRQPVVASGRHVIGRDQAKQLGWSDDRINSRANTQPQHVRCSASSGGKYVPPVLSPSANGWARRR